MLDMVRDGLVSLTSERLEDEVYSFTHRDTGYLCPSPSGRAAFYWYTVYFPFSLFQYYLERGTCDRDTEARRWALTLAAP